MHDIQKRILELSGRKDLEVMKLREIGEEIGVIHPQLVKHHLEQLRKKGLIFLKMPGSTKFVNIPIFGSANCGEPTMLAEDNLEGYLKISESFLGKKIDDLYSLKAVGLSMNKANIDGQAINDGDYVVVDKSQSAAQNGDYVVSIIEGAANIKRFHFDVNSNQVVLFSESSQDFPPIYIDATNNFVISGKVVKVFKKPQLKN